MWMGWSGSGAYLEGQTPPVPPHVFLPSSQLDVAGSTVAPASWATTQTQLAFSPPKAAAAFCASSEGWGPLSPLRPLDLTPCFELGTLQLLPALIMICFGMYYFSALLNKCFSFLTSRLF